VIIATGSCFGATASYQSQSGPKGTTAIIHSLGCAETGLQPENVVRIRAEYALLPISENPLVNIAIFTRDINVTAEIKFP
jgi:hypothetical protein